MLSSRDMKHSLVIGTSRISADIHIRMIINLHIPTALFNVFATTSPPICIYRQHFSTFSTLHRRQPAPTLHRIWHYFTINLHMSTSFVSTCATVSPPACIHRLHFSAVLPLLHHQHALTDVASRPFCHCLTTNLHTSTALFRTMN